jgi:hypothetical protein
MDQAESSRDGVHCRLHARQKPEESRAEVVPGQQNGPRPVVKLQQEFTPWGCVVGV